MTLFHVNDGNIVGIYSDLSWDSPIQRYDKNDMDTFIFNLNKNQKCKKLTEKNSVFCSSAYGPWTACFGCRNSNKFYCLKKINFPPYSSDFIRIY